jgi:uncharacterized membrane protein
MKPAQKKSAELTLQHSQSFSGPIPDPESLAKYNTVMPGLAERIIAMAENEAKNRHENEKILIKNSIKLSFIGIIFAFVAVILFCLLILFALYKGYNLATLGLAIGAIASVAGLFIIFRSSSKKQE